jgi:MFS family permease
VLVDWQSWRWVFFVNLLFGLPALVAARRLLRESREKGASLPDPLGAALLAAGAGALALAIVEGPQWGWSSGGVLGSVAASALLVAAFLRRTVAHPTPVFELSLFRVRSFAVANAALFVYSLGFYALLLGNVLFLTGPWHDSALHAGFALTPGPLMAALSAPVAGRLADRFGQRTLAIPGGLLFAGGLLYFVAATGVHRDYAGAFLPGMLLTGTGVGLTFSSLSSAVVAELPRTRFATGTAIASTARQIGAVLGISTLLAIVGPAPTLHDFRIAWMVAAAEGVAVAALGSGLGRVRARHVEAPERAPDAVPVLAE